MARDVLSVHRAYDHADVFIGEEDGNMLTAAFFLTVFLSALLLFVIQPMLTKVLLPEFGGSYLVWGSAMVFFQTVLLAGYILGHTAQRRLGTRRYAPWHAALLLLPLAFFPFDFEAARFSSLRLPLAFSVFGQLAMMISGPFLVLSMTSLVLQRWLMLSPSTARSNPYVLYSASNIGSVAALLAYPILIEPYFSLDMQGVLWWWGYGILVLLHVACYPWRSAGQIVRCRLDHPSPRLRHGKLSLARCGNRTQRHWSVWFMLSFSACALLLAVTNMLTFDLAAVPMLWVIPLALYLLAFVLTFKQIMWFPRWMAAGMNGAVLAAALFFLLQQLRLRLPPAVAVVLHLLLLFVLCMNASARLVQTRPEGEDALTGFYVALAAGGLGGSLFVSWVVPQMSNSLVEYVIAPALVLVACGQADRKRGDWTLSRNRKAWFAVAGMIIVMLLPLMLSRFGLTAIWTFLLTAIPLALLLRAVAAFPTLTALLLLIVAFGSGGWSRSLDDAVRVATKRNYYGIYTIFDREGQRFLQHGTTLHGRQYLDPAKQDLPLGYYHPSTPAAHVMQQWQQRFSDVGMVGLGTGALALYAREDAHLRIIELDADNHALAEHYFSYLAQSRQRGTQLEIVIGDGRVVLRQFPPHSLDLLIVDAFNSGSIPVHLITTDAMKDYFGVLRQNGLLLIHISNRVLDLAPVIYANAYALGVHACEQSNAGDLAPGADETIWMAVSPDPDVISALKRACFWYSRRQKEWHHTQPWTDQYSHLIGAIRWLH